MSIRRNLMYMSQRSLIFLTQSHVAIFGYRRLTGNSVQIGVGRWIRTWRRRGDEMDGQQLTS